MDKAKELRAKAVIDGIQRALDQGVAYFDKAGKPLRTPMDVIGAWVKGGVTSKEPFRPINVLQWGILKPAQAKRRVA